MNDNGTNDNAKLPDHDAVVGVLLAGGLARRMGGGDKSLRQIGGKTLLAHAIERLEPQVGTLILNANGDPERFSSFGLPVVPDGVPDHPGPLAGVLAGLEWARANAPSREWVVTVPTDAPAFPRDLVDRLVRAAIWDEVPVSCAASGERRHPVFAAWHVDLADRLREALVERQIRKVDLFTAETGIAVASWPAEPVDPFLNVNRPEDLATAERLLAVGG